MHDSEGGLEALEFAIRIQSGPDVAKGIRIIGPESKMQAARVVLSALVNSSETVHSEFCVSFVQSLLILMIEFVSGLILDRVSRIKESPEMCTSLSKRIESPVLCLSLLPQLVQELEECGRYLTCLRRLQSDMIMRTRINAGESEPGDVISRSGTPLVSIFPDRSSKESVVEKSLLISNPCVGMFWLGSRFHAVSANHMRAMARLIAYSFISSPSLDSFFVGLHILRNSGHHVEDVLTAFYRDTCIKFVRDRILFHLSHRDFKPNRDLRRVEELYSNNCYWTELCRAWSRINKGHGGQSRIGSGGLCHVQPIACGNVLDIPESLDRPISGLSQEESLSVLKCSSCLDANKPSSESVSRGRMGYLNLTVSWIEGMSDKQIGRILMEAGGTEIDLEYALLHKEWKAVSELAATNQSELDSDHGTFLNRLLIEGSLAMSDRHDDLARTKRLFTGESPCPKHVEMLKWFIVENDLPQLALLYLRRFSLGSNREEVDKLCDRVGNNICFMALGRLGDVVQPPNTSMEHLAVWMTSHVAPPESIFRDIPTVSVLFADTHIVENYSHRTCTDILSLETFKEDVCLIDLLGDYFPNLELVEGIPQQLPLGTTGTSQVDELEYLIAQGRPSLAYSRFAGTEIGSSALQKSARRVALYNLFDDGVVASAVALLDLFSESTETLRVDVQCARTIGGEVRDMFLNFEKGQSQLLNALKLLEESAWANEPPLGVADQGTAAPGGFESPWHLVALFWYVYIIFRISTNMSFSRVHSLPRSLTLLHELARNGDWVMFLHESDIQQCPIETVQDVVQLYFSSPLRSHLNILLDVRDDGAAERLETPEFIDDRATSTDARIAFQAALGLYKFEQARNHYHCLSETEQRTIMDSYRDSPVVLEIDPPQYEEDAYLIDEAQSSWHLETPTRVVNPSPLDLQLVREGRYSELSACINTPEAVASLISILTQDHVTSIEWVDSKYEAFVGMLSFEMAEHFGDQLRVVEVSSERLRCHFDNLSYYSYVFAFVDDSKLETFLKSSRCSLKLLETTSGMVSKGPLESLVASVHHETAKMIDAGGSHVSLLQGLVHISEHYDAVGLFKKHMDVNLLADVVLERIRTI